MEGPAGLWWGTILSVAFAESAQGTPLGLLVVVLQWELPLQGSSLSLSV